MELLLWLQNCWLWNIKLTYSLICGLKSLMRAATIRSISVIVHKSFTSSWKGVRGPKTAEFPYTVFSTDITKHLNVIFGAPETLGCGRGGRREKEGEKEEGRWRIRSRKKRMRRRGGGELEKEEGRIMLQLVVWLNTFSYTCKPLTDCFTSYQLTNIWMNI